METIKRIRTLILIIFLVSGLSAQNLTKAGTTAAQFLKIDVGPRAIGMGGAFTATAIDISAIYWNPAGLAYNMSGEAFFNHTDWFLDIALEYAGVAVHIPGVGTIGGFSAIGFRYLIDMIQALTYGARGNLLELALASPWYVKLIVPSLGGLVVGPLVYFLAREAKGHGVPEVMEAIALRQGIIRKRVVIIKSIASALNLSPDYFRR